MIFSVLKVLLKPLAIPCRFFKPLVTMHNILYPGCLWCNCAVRFDVCCLPTSNSFVQQGICRRQYLSAVICMSCLAKRCLLYYSHERVLLISLCAVFSRDLYASFVVESLRH
jgi:hypothetical protein